ncbi:hypothetical protein ACLKA6_006697 [Drosophila palustris]
MLDVVKCMLRYFYYYTRFIGLINFDVDTRTGRARTTRRTTIYAALMNVMTIGSVSWLLNSQVVHIIWSRAGYLHEYIMLAMICGYVLCFVLTILTRWWQRPLYVRLVNAIQRLAKQRPQVMRLWRRGVISKVSSVILSQLLQMIISLFVVNDQLTLETFLGLAVLTGIIAQVNVTISQYYFALLNIHGHYILINEELRLLLDETRSLETDTRKGVYITKCCFLADRLDVIAEAQFQLQALVQQISSIFGLQIMSMSIIYYLSIVSLNYFIFSEFHASTITVIWSYGGLALTIITFLSYYIDMHITVNIIYAVLDLHAQVIDLLSQYTLIASRLDERLDAAFESFKLQLAFNPLKFSVLGLYTVQKTRLVSMGNSIISSSTVLVQYDIQHF